MPYTFSETTLNLNSTVGTELNSSKLLMNRQKQSLEGMKMAHPFCEQDLVEQTDSKEPMAQDGFGAGFMLAGRQTKLFLHLVSCRFSSTF